MIVSSSSLRPLLAAAAALLLAGCLGTPKDNLYTLNPVIEATAPVPITHYTVEIAAVTIPDLVDRPQIVLRDTDNKVSMLEQQRWASSLSSQLPQVIADNIGQLLPDARVKATGEASAGEVTYRVAVDIQRFDSVLDRAAILDAQWSARRLADGALLVGRFTVSEPAGPGYEALAAAHGRALGGLSRQIADAIEADRTSAAVAPAVLPTPKQPR
jgi:uncharacterized lipoprotein YmbA